MILYICEKPSQALSYAKALNISSKKDGYFEQGDTCITWCVGHLLTALAPADYDSKYKTWNLNDLPILPREKWKLKPNPRVLKQLNTVKNLIGKADTVYIASDADREGEFIVTSLLEQFNFTGKRMRVWTGALDKVTILKKIKEAFPADRGTSDCWNRHLSASTRQEIDWLHGLNLTRAMTTVNAHMLEKDVFLSVGRVQSATLALIYQRDKEILEFVPIDFYDLSCQFNVDSKMLKTSYIIPKSFLNEDNYCLDKSKIEEVADKIRGKDAIVTKSEKNRKKENAPLPFNLNLLQVECDKKFGYSPSDTLSIAQSLYETHKATTYPRTDCQYLNSEQFNLVSTVFKAIVASDPSYSTIVSNANPSFKTKVWNDKKVEAHHAIIPTQSKFDYSKLNDKEKNVYDIIRARYVAQFYPLAESDQTSLEFECEGEKFKASGTIPVLAGWKTVLGKESSKDKDDELPLLEKGSRVTNALPKVDSKKTKPPAFFTNGTIISAMVNADKFVESKEDKIILKGSETRCGGIGTEPTRADIIDKLYARKYIKAEKKNIRITELGKALIEALPPKIKSITLTAKWEKQLTEIEKGNLKVEDFLAEQELELIETLDLIKAGKCTFKAPIGSLYNCPNCNSGLTRIKSKKNGKHYWVCRNRENCSSIFADNRGKPYFPEPVDQGDKEHICQVCSKGKLVRHYKKENDFYYWTCPQKECDAFYYDENVTPILRVIKEVNQGTEKFKCFSCKKDNLIRKSGRYGFYWTCPSCKNNFKESEDEKPIEPVKKVIEKSDYKCPNCKDGYLIKRSGAKGDFFGCNCFPKCKTIKSVAENGKPEGF